MIEPDNVSRRQQILDAAFRTFISYGFKRTTMADIAQAAHVSRPVLYLEFKNKIDIFRAKFLDMLDETIGVVEVALDGPEPIADRLALGLVSGTVGALKPIVDTPHGAELFDLKQEIASDLGALWFDRLETCLSRAIAEAVRRGELDLAGAETDSAGLARLLVSAVEGVKARMTDCDAASADIARLVILIVKPLATGR